MPSLKDLTAHQQERMAMVERYRGGKMRVHADGAYVSHEDYVAALREIGRLRGLIERWAAPRGTHKTCTCRQCWDLMAEANRGIVQEQETPRWTQEKNDGVGDGQAQ